MSGVDGNRLLNDSGVGNNVTRSLCRYNTKCFMKSINNQNNVNNMIEKYNTMVPVSSTVDVSFIYQVILR